MILNLGSKLALNSAHFTRGLVKHAAGRGVVAGTMVGVVGTVGFC